MRTVYKNLCPVTISASIMASNMWKNSLKNVESDKNNILYETLLDFLQRNCIYFLNKPLKMLHVEHSFIWCWHFDASGSRSGTPGKFWNVVLEKDGEDQLDRSCEKWRSIKEQRNILHEISKRKAKGIGHILRRNCLLQQVTEGKIRGWGVKVTGRWGRRRRKLLNDLKERRGYSHLKEETLDRTMWRAYLEESLDLSQDRLLIEWMCPRCLRNTQIFSDHFSIIHPRGTEIGSSCLFINLLIWVLLHP